MTKASALHEFFNSFGIPAYVATSVPDNAQMPYITYTYGVNGFDMGSFSCTVNVYYRTESEAVPNAKVEEIERVIDTRGGCSVAYDGGVMWIKRGTPWVQAIGEPDMTIKRRYINIEIDYV